MMKLSELRELVKESHVTADNDVLYRIRNAVPDLLEIAEAAWALAGPSKTSDACIPEWNSLLAAIAKVQP